MAIFQYEAINRSGQSIHGRIEADSSQVAVSLLAEQGRFVSTIDLLTEEPGRSQAGQYKVTVRLKLKNRERAEFIRQLATALQAQLPILAALDVVGRQNPSLRVKRLVAEVTVAVKSGQSLSYTFSQYQRSFDRLHTSLIGIGESSGELGRSISQLADLVEGELETRNNIMTAALYPFFVLCLGMLSIGIVVTWILPRVLSTISGDVDMLPWPTRVVLNISHFLSSPPGIIFIVSMCFLAILLSRWRKFGFGKLVYDSLKLKVPILGMVQRKWAVARFARTLGTLSVSGINILDSLAIVRNCLGNEILARDVDLVARQVRSGSSLAGPMRKSGLYPPLLVQIVTVGEQTGQLAPMLLNAADAFDRETNVAIGRFMAIFPAILITILALIIGFIVAATLLPIVQIETALPGLHR